MTFTSTASVFANLTVSAMLEVDLADPLNFTLDVEPVVAMVGVDATPTLELPFESIVLSSAASLSADGAVAVCVGDTSCDSFGAESVINATSTIEMYHSIGHDLSGELEAQVGSVDLDANASFHLFDAKVFDDVKRTSTPTSTTSISSRASPSDCFWTASRPCSTCSAASKTSPYSTIPSR